jgi:dihydrofolate reductase
MRKIVANFFVSLDGVVERPDQWHFPYFNDEMGQAVGASMAGSDTMLLGRRTYDEFAAYWPQQPSDVPPADQMNNTPKIVVSNTLARADWQNSRIVRGDDLAAELNRLKQEDGKNVGTIGSATLVRSLLRDGLLDELHLLVHPLVVGSGKRLFEEGTGKVPLALLSSKSFSTGVLHLIYGRADPITPTS